MLRVPFSHSFLPDQSWPFVPVPQRYGLRRFKAFGLINGWRERRRKKLNRLTRRFCYVFSESAGFRLDFISWRASQIIVSICQHVITTTKYQAKAIIYRSLFLVILCRTWHRVTAFYVRLYFPTLLHGIAVSVEELDVRNCLIAPYSLPFLSFSCRAMYFVLEYVRDEIPSELREKVCR